MISFTFFHFAGTWPWGRRVPMGLVYFNDRGSFAHGKASKMYAIGYFPGSKKVISRKSSSFRLKKTAREKF
jgi:hypothetical protein